MVCPAQHALQLPAFFRLGHPDIFQRYKATLRQALSFRLQKCAGHLPECRFVQQRKALDIAFFPQCLAVLPAAVHRVLYQIACCLQPVDLGKGHPLPRQCPQHQDQAELFLFINTAGHQRRFGAQGPVHIDPLCGKFLCHLFHVPIAKRVPKLPRLLRGKREQPGRAVFFHHIDRSGRGIHQLRQDPGS